MAPLLEPPPPRGAELSREDVLRVARAAEHPEDAILRLDRHRFSFPLDAEALEWLRAQALRPAVLDYLEKRAEADWEGSRGDVDPDAGPR